MGKGHNHLQIARQFFDGGSRWRFRLCFTLELQKQLRLFEETLPDLGRGISPGGIQLAGLPAAELVSGKRGGHLLALVQADTGYRHQTLHGHLRRDLAGTHLFLHAVGKKLDQRQAA